MAAGRDAQPSPGFKLLLAILIGVALAIPLFSVWLLVYDRQSQSRRGERARSPTAGAGRRRSTGPVLVIPYRATATETVVENGQSVTRSREVMRELTLAPETRRPSRTDIKPELRKRSIYEAVVYDAPRRGPGALRLPARPRAASASIRATMDLGRAELRFGLSDPRGLGANPEVERRRPAAPAPAGRRQQRRARLLRLGRCQRARRPADRRRLRL